MKHTTTKLFRRLCGVVMVLALVASIMTLPVLAASNGIYIATATPHYKHPATGNIEDSGGENSAVLGQSMAESVTYEKALVEIDAVGDTYVTVRLQLMDNIKTPQFQVDGKSVAASLMQEDYVNNTADYRMKVNSVDSIIRCNIYVIAMGREVAFYITVSNLQLGEEDFITSITIEEEKQTTPEPTTAVQVTPEPTTTALQATTEPVTTEAVTTAEQVTTQEVTTEPETTTESETTTSEETTTVKAVKENDSKSDSEKVKGLEEFDASGNQVEEEASETQETKKNEKGSFVAGWVIGGIIIVAAAGFCVWYFGFFKKKK